MADTAGTYITTRGEELAAEIAKNISGPLEPPQKTTDHTCQQSPWPVPRGFVTPCQSRPSLPNTLAPDGKHCPTYQIQASSDDCAQQRTTTCVTVKFTQKQMAVLTVVCNETTRDGTLDAADVQCGQKRRETRTKKFVHTDEILKMAASTIPSGQVVRDVLANLLDFGILCHPTSASQKLKYGGTDLKKRQQFWALTTTGAFAFCNEIQRRYSEGIMLRKIVQAAPAPATTTKPLLSPPMLPGTTEVPSLPGTSIPSVPGTSMPSLPGTSVPSLPGTSVPFLPGTAETSTTTTMVQQTPVLGRRSDGPTSGNVATVMHAVVELSVPRKLVYRVGARGRPGVRFVCAAEIAAATGLDTDTIGAILESLLAERVVRHPTQDQFRRYLRRRKIQQQCVTKHSLWAAAPECMPDG